LGVRSLDKNIVDAWTRSEIPGALASPIEVESERLRTQTNETDVTKQERPHLSHFHTLLWDRKPREQVWAAMRQSKGSQKGEIQEDHTYSWFLTRLAEVPFHDLLCSWKGPLLSCVYAWSSITIRVIYRVS
jgi:hypothetical protein